MMGTAQTRSSHSNVNVQEATLEITAKPLSMNVPANCVRMMELAEMVSMPTSVSVQVVTLGKTVKATSTNVEQIPANMMHHVTMKTKDTGVVVHMVSLEATVKLILMTAFPNRVELEDSVKILFHTTHVRVILDTMGKIVML